MNFELKLSNTQKKAIAKQIKKARNKGCRHELERLAGILAFADGVSACDLAKAYRVTIETVKSWIYKYLCCGVKGLSNKKRPGRPAKLTKKQRKELAKIIEGGPEKAGFPGNCWRSPMIQFLIQERWGIIYNVNYLSELLKNMGFSYQKARFVADKRDEEAREMWLRETWPEILEKARQKNSYLLFGDECSFPQWGTLSYTWAPTGEQPTIKTCGKRKGYKVFGLIDYFTGRLFSKGIEGKLNGESYVDFLKDVLARKRKHIILIEDGAPYHRSKLVKAFISENKDRITTYKLPSYSPDLNPIEMLWKKIKEKGTHLHFFPTFESLVNKVDATLEIFEHSPKEVLALFGKYQEKNAI